MYCKHTLQINTRISLISYMGSEGPHNIFGGWYRLVTVHSWRLYSASALEQQTTSTMTCYPTQLHYLYTEPISPCPILIMPSVRLGSDKYQVSTQPGFENCKVRIRTRDFQVPRSSRTTHSDIQTGY